MKIEWKSCFKIGITAFLLFLAIHYWEAASGFLKLLLGASTSLILGCIIAYVLNILMSFYEKHYFNKNPKLQKGKRVICMIGAIATLIGIVIILVHLVVPELVKCVKLIINDLPDSMERFTVFIQENKYIDKILSDEFVNSLASINWEQKIMNIANLLLGSLGGVAEFALTAVSSVASVVVKLVIGIIFAIYILLGKERIFKQFKLLTNKYMKTSWNEKIRYGISVFNSSFHRFIVGQCTEAVILGVLCIIGMTILRMPYAVMIGALIGFTALIPIAGAYIGAGVGAIMILTVSPIQALWFLIFIVVLQQFEGNVIYPKVVGTSIGLPAVWVLAAVTIGGGIFGIPGMLFGVPSAAAIYQLLRNDVYDIKEKIEE